MASSAANASSSASPKRISLSYDPSNSDASARKLVLAINPEWGTSEGDIQLVPLTDGITNILFKIIKNRPGYTQHQIEQEAVLLRAYGDDTDIIIDRDREAQSHALLHSLGLAPMLFARFDNGLLYEYIEGYACSPADLRRPDVWPSTAKLLGKWHGALPTNHATDGASDNVEKQYDLVKSLIPDKPLPHMWSIMQKWINALPTKTEEEKTLVKDMRQAMEDTARMFGATPGLDHGKYVMSHLDLLSGNVIVKPTNSNGVNSSGTADVEFIDYEYLSPAPSAFDLSNHFAEWGGFECDYTVIPTRSQRRAFIREYVAAYRAQSKPQANGDAVNGNAKTPSQEEDVEQLMKEVDEFRGLPGLFWGLWGTIQAIISSIDFDYATYAERRLSEYAMWKAEMDGSRQKKGEEKPVREARWDEE